MSSGGAIERVGDYLAEFAAAPDDERVDRDGAADVDLTFGDLREVHRIALLAPHAGHNMLRTAGYGGSAKPAVEPGEAASEDAVDGRGEGAPGGLNGGSAPP